MTEESTQHKQNTVYLCRSSATALVLSPLLVPSLLLYPLMLLLLASTTWIPFQVELFFSFPFLSFSSTLPIQASDRSSDLNYHTCF